MEERLAWRDSPARRQALAQRVAGPHQAAALQRGQEEGHRGPLEDDQGRAREGGRALSGPEDSGPRQADRDESDEDRLHRNFNELLQELRVTQTGVQILTGFLLTVPFTQRFPSLDAIQRNGYLAVLVGSVVATGLIIAPVAMHRTLFRQGEKEWLINAANWCARLGLLALALTMCGVVWLVFDVVVSRTAALVAGGLALAFLTLLWGAFPLVKRAD